MFDFAHFDNRFLLCLFVWFLESAARLLERIVCVWPSNYDAILAQCFVSLACEIQRLPSPQMCSRDQSRLGPAHFCGRKELLSRSLWLAQ